MTTAMASAKRGSTSTRVGDGGCVACCDVVVVIVVAAVLVTKVVPCGWAVLLSVPAPAPVATTIWPPVRWVLLLLLLSEGGGASG